MNYRYQNHQNQHAFQDYKHQFKHVMCELNWKSYWNPETRQLYFRISSVRQTIYLWRRSYRKIHSNALVYGMLCTSARHHDKCCCCVLPKSYWYTTQYHLHRMYRNQLSLTVCHCSSILNCLADLVGKYIV